MEPLNNLKMHKKEKFPRNHTSAATQCKAQLHSPCQCGPGTNLSSSRNTWAVRAAIGQHATTALQRVIPCTAV